MKKKIQKENNQPVSSKRSGRYCLPQRLLSFLLVVAMVLTSGGMQQVYASEVGESTEMVTEQDETEYLEETELFSETGMVALEVEEESESDADTEIEADEDDQAKALDLRVYADASDLLAGAAAFGVEETEDVDTTENQLNTEEADLGETGKNIEEAEVAEEVENGLTSEQADEGECGQSTEKVVAEESELTAEEIEADEGEQQATGELVTEESEQDYNEDVATNDESAQSEDDEDEDETIVNRSGYNSSSSTIVAQGTTLFDLTWTLDSAGTLTISGGTGQDYDIIADDDEWAEYRDSVVTVVIEEGVTEIYSYVFEEYKNLVTVTIPESVTEIGSNIFYGCTSLKKVTISAKITELEYQSFYGCTSLTSVKLPSTLEEIGSYAFAGCTNLKSITIPSGVTSIGYAAFYKCSKLTSISVPSGVTLIDGYTFCDCTKLSSITLPSGISSIEENAFYGCSSLTSIVIPATVESIGWCAFSDCTSLSSLTISSGVKTIGEYAFSDCLKLTSVTIPSSVTSMGSSAFDNCASLKKVVIKKGLKEIPQSAFANCEKLTSVTLPSSITKIGDYAFTDCIALTSITIPSSTTSIGGWAFSWCKKLSSITIPSSVTSLGKYAFESCTSLKTVTIKKGLTSIKERTFYNCSKLTSVTLPSGITSIGSYAFYGCSSLTNITLPSTLKTLSESAFSDCSSLEAVTIPAKVSTIGTYAFYGCDSLCYLYIKDGVKKIGTYAFYGCESLEIMRIPKSVTSIGKYAFYGCYGLEEIYYGGTKSNWSSISIGSENTLLNYATYTYSSTTSVVLPKNEVTELQILSSGIRVRWTASYGAKGYYIYRKVSGGSYEKVGKVESGSTLYYTDTSVTKNKTYYYKVKAYSGSAKSAYSSAKSIKFLKGTVKTVSNPSAEKTFTSESQNYGSYSSSTTDSYLVAVDSGFMRVEYTDDGYVVVEYYNSKWKLTSKKKITCELDRFGGFYAGENAYYLVFGQSNSSESDNNEVIRIVKYSTSWTRKSNVSIYGSNTTVPFDAGSLDMTEYGGYLYIHTSHEMYKWIDGLNHQANMTIEVKESDMTVTDSYYDISNNSTGYVSHSFNQRILVDDSGNLVTADHGDAVPRAMILVKYKTKAGKSTFNGSVSSVKTFSFKGAYGENYTGATLGGFEYSGSSYILAGSSVKQNSSWSSNSQYNIFITVTSRSKFSSSGTTTKWITSYSEGSKVDVSNPHLVKISNSKFLLMWTENDKTLKYVFLDGKGNKTTSIYSVSALMSDCQPIYSNGYVYWYTTGAYTADSGAFIYIEDTKPTLYAIKVSSPYGVLASTGSLAKPTLNSVSNASGGVKISWTGSLNATGYIIYRKSGSGSYKKLKTISSNKTTTYTDTSAKSGTKYTYKILVYTKSGSTTKKSSYSSEKSVSYLTAGKISSLTNTSSGIKIKWSKVSKATGYYIYRKTSSGIYSKIATIKKNSTTSYTDTAVKSKNGTTYVYKVVPYNSSATASFVSKTAVRLTGTTLSSVKNSSSKAMTVKWSKKSSITGYQIQYSASSSFASGNKSVTVTSASTTSKAISSLTKGKTYYVRIRTYKTVSGTKYYSAWSSKKSVKISK